MVADGLCWSLTLTSWLAFALKTHPIRNVQYPAPKCKKVGGSVQGLGVEKGRCCFIAFALPRKKKKDQCIGQND